MSCRRQAGWVKRSVVIVGESSKDSVACFFGLKKIGNDGGQLFHERFQRLGLGVEAEQVALLRVDYLLQVLQLVAGEARFLFGG